jgi:hypothetical protein
MHPLLALALFLVVVLIGLYAFVSVKPATLVRAIRTFTTTFAALAGTGLLLTGRFGLALVTFIAAMAALRALRGSVASVGWGSGAGGSANGDQASEIQTDTLAMRLDHRTGDLDGEVLRGPFAGRQLETLGLQDLLALLVDCQQEDPRSVPLMETYLDRRHPEWRSHAGDDRHADSGSHGGHASNSRMDVATACQILDVAPNAAPDEIKAAHRRLMNKLHPDHGGSSFLAAQLNEAKDVLLNR